MREDSGVFVHYTSAENAGKTITFIRIWLRNARYMNDYSEAYFQHQQLIRIFQDEELKAALISALASYGENTGNRVLMHFDEW